MARKKFLEEQRQRLLEMRREALGTLEVGRREAADMATEDGRDPADLAERDVEASARLQVAGHGFDLLREIDDALVRMRRGAYGICELTGKEIPQGRLQALPFARYTVEAQASFEQRGRAALRQGAWGDGDGDGDGDADGDGEEAEADS